MRYLLDTTLLIDHAKGRPGAVEVVQELFREPNEMLICDAIVTEALSGVDADQVGAILVLIDALEYVSTHPDAARWAGASRSRLRRTSPRQLGDAIIAGVAWFMDATVVTRNPADFEIQGVRVLGYE